jgi:trimethyllysine dioxygenase
MALAAHTDNTYFVRPILSPSIHPPHTHSLFPFSHPHVHACVSQQTDPCGVQIFHLLEHTGGTGGASLLVDGFYAASILRDLHPDAYDLLSTVPIPAHAAGESGTLYRAAHTLLEHDAVGKHLRAVRWNNDDRSALRNVPYEDVPRLYDAMRTWDKLITSQDSEYWVQLSPGTVIGVFFLSLSTFLPPPQVSSFFLNLI